MTNRVLIGVSGGIAAYKVCEVVSTLAKQNNTEVKVILTQAATEFVTPLTFATLSRHTAYADTDFWQPSHGRPLHIELGEWADLFLLAPLTANTLAKLAYGMADNLLTNTVLASKCPVLLAPAMNTTMWEQATVRQNWRNLLENDRYVEIALGSGILACDVVGAGRMAEPAEILTYIESLLWTRGKDDLVGKRVLVSAGGTREFLDPVRFIGNPATGKQGIAIALAALHRGADVTLVLGNPESNRQVLPTGSNCKIIGVVSSAQMHQTMQQEFAQADLTIMSAAVGDVRPANYNDRKTPKAQLPESLPLAPIADILADLSARKRSEQTLVGFAAQTGSEAEIVAIAQQKLKTKGIDAIAVNQVDRLNTGFASDTNQATFLATNGKQVATPLCSKLELAHRLLDFLTDAKILPVD
jgi:phosphopantothenoylcysteine decarboxylase / phosphopantothenate---cysteine ligase